MQERQILIKGPSQQARVSAVSRYNARPYEVDVFAALERPTESSVTELEQYAAPF